jgi:hypothetical protein
MNISKTLICTAVWLVAAMAGGGQNTAQPGRFDKLPAADRAAFVERFQKEVWPLLTRNGKDGCVGCHSAKKGGTLHFSGNAEKDFNMLLGDGYLLKGDSGSLLGRIQDRDKKRRMPQGERPPWTKEEAETLRQFVDDIHLKNKV